MRNFLKPFPREVSYLQLFLHNFMASCYVNVKRHLQLCCLDMQTLIMVAVKVVDGEPFPPPPPQYFCFVKSFTLDSYLVLIFFFFLFNFMQSVCFKCAKRRPPVIWKDFISCGICTLVLWRQFSGKKSIVEVIHSEGVHFSMYPVHFLPPPPEGPLNHFPLYIVICYSAVCDLLVYFYCSRKAISSWRQMQPV